MLCILNGKKHFVYVYAIFIPFIGGFNADVAVDVELNATAVQRVDDGLHAR